jgi:hypothetical protein
MASSQSGNHQARDRADDHGVDEDRRGEAEAKSLMIRSSPTMKEAKTVTMIAAAAVDHAAGEGGRDRAHVASEG